MSRSVGRDIPRYIFHVIGHSELIEAGGVGPGTSAVRVEHRSAPRKVITTTVRLARTRVLQSALGSSRMSEQHCRLAQTQLHQRTKLWPPAVSLSAPPAPDRFTSASSSETGRSYSKAVGIMRRSSSSTRGRE